MKKSIVYLFVVSLLFSCSLNFPSVCDNLKEPSLLCNTASKYNVRIEDIGNALIIANAIAIGEGRYTREEAVGVLKDLKSALDSPITYALFRSEVYGKINKYPGLYEISEIYFGELVGDNIMFGFDRNLLSGWIDDRIKAME